MDIFTEIAQIKPETHFLLQIAFQESSQKCSLDTFWETPFRLVSQTTSAQTSGSAYVESFLEQHFGHSPSTHSASCPT